jgi:hypothetical protein
MSKLSRRRFLQTTAALPLLYAPRCARASTTPSVPTRPRRFILLQLGGCPDTIYGLDPKRRKDVADKVDVPYAPDLIVSSTHGEIGPLFRPLLPYLPQMAVIRGIDAGTVAHEFGDLQITHLCKKFSVNKPAIGDIVGRLVSDDDPVTAVAFSRSYQRLDWVPPQGREIFLGDNGELLEAIAKLNASGRLSLKVMTRALDAAGSAPAVKDTMLRNARWFERFPKAAKPSPSPIDKPTYTPNLPIEIDSEYAAVLQEQAGLLATRMDWIHYVCEHSLATSVFVNTPFLQFDTHAENHVGQVIAHGVALAAVRYLLDRLARTKRSNDQTLLDETALVITGEFGRFPVLNSLRGKDHFPEMATIVLGPGIRAGMYGETDEWMTGKRIDFSSGRPGGANARKPNVDDLGATVLHWFGANRPADYGYAGEPFRFLWA